MKICLFHPYDFNGKIGGTDIYVMRLCHELIEQKINVFIICPGTKREISLVNNVTVYRINMYGDNRISILEGGEVCDGYKDFKSIIDKESPNIVHFHGFGKTYLPYFKYLKDINTKTILTPHLSTLTCSVSGLIQFPDTFCDGIVEKYKCAKCILGKHKSNLFARTIYVGVNNAIARTTAYRSHSKFDVVSRVYRLQKMMDTISHQFDNIIVLNSWYKDLLIRNGFELKNIEIIKTSIAKNPSIIDFTSRPFRILFAGRQNVPKGLHVLLDALSNYDLDTKVQLLIAGPQDSNDLHLINQKMSNLNTDKIEVVQLGFVDNDSLLEISKSVHLNCVPSSDAEMCPLIVLESQSIGLPVLGSNHTGIKDLIEPGLNGFLFERNDSSDLLLQLKKLICNLELLKNVNSYLNELSNDDSDMLKKHIRLYNRLVSSHE